MVDSALAAAPSRAAVPALARSGPPLRSGDGVGPVAWQAGRAGLPGQPGQPGPSSQADPVARLRHQVPALLLLPGQQVPSAETTALHLPPGLRAAQQALARAAAQALARDAGTDALSALLEDAAEWLPAARPPASLLPRDPLQADDPHDAYFRIERTHTLHEAGSGMPTVPGRAPTDKVSSPTASPTATATATAAALHQLAAVVEATRRFLDEAGAPAERRHYADITVALVDSWQQTVGLRGAWPATAGAASQAAADPAQPAHAPEPVRRWVVGHQVFAVLTQALLATLPALQRAIARRDWPEACGQAARVARLYRASASAFRFASDFDPRHYADTIRPSMSEPHVPAGFSGTLSSDHGRLVAWLGGLKPLWPCLREQAPAAWAEVQAALQQVYDEHKRVCARFDGAQLPSLRSARREGALPGARAKPSTDPSPRTGTEPLSGVQMLQRFQDRRLAMLG